MERIHLEQEIAKAGLDSHGIVTRSGLRELGCTEFQIDYRLKRGTLWPVFSSSYSVGGPARSWRAVWLAAVLSAGPGSMLAGMAAAALWRLTEQKSREVAVNRARGHNRIEQTRPESGWALSKQVRVRSDLPSQPAFVSKIPVLPVPELLVDLAGTATPRQLEGIVSAASQKKHLNEAIVRRLLKHGQGRKGIKELRKQLRYWDPEMRRALSVLETMFIRMCKQHGLEVPKANEWVCGLLVDFVWFGQRVVVEVDGFTYHGDRLAFERDHDRPAILMRNGYLRLSFTWRQVVEDPEQVVATVLAALTAWNH
jgi:very-short-patch-repair endonuclease